MSSALDRELNEAIVNGDIGNSYEEFRQFDHCQIGGPLTSIDFGLDGPRATLPIPSPLEVAAI